MVSPSYLVVLHRGHKADTIVLHTIVKGGRRVEHHCHIYSRPPLVAFDMTVISTITWFHFSHDTVFPSNTLSIHLRRTLYNISPPRIVEMQITRQPKHAIKHSELGKGVEDAAIRNIRMRL